jgi:hypothetical protein
VLPVKRAHSRIDSGQKLIVGGDAPAGSEPHIGDVQILTAIVVDVHPAGTHTGPVIFDACFLRNVGEGAVSVVAVEILPPEVVCHMEVRPSVIVVIAPRCGKRKAIVVLIHSA